MPTSMVSRGKGLGNIWERTPCVAADLWEVIGSSAKQPKLCWAIFRPAQGYGTPRVANDNKPRKLRRTGGRPQLQPTQVLEANTPAHSSTLRRQTFSSSQQAYLRQARARARQARGRGALEGCGPLLKLQWLRPSSNTTGSSKVASGIDSLPKPQRTWNLQHRNALGSGLKGNTCVPFCPWHEANVASWMPWACGNPRKSACLLSFEAHRAIRRELRQKNLKEN